MGIKFLKKNKNQLFLFFLFFLFLIYNFYVPRFNHDDIIFLKRVSSMGYITSSIDYYRLWSSRIIIELLLMFFSKHFVFWKIINTTIMWGTVVMLCKYVFRNLEIKNVLLVSAVYCFIPLQLMGETGWVATTLNYHWIIAFLMASFYPFYQRLQGEKINLPIYFAVLPFLIVSSNQEQANICFLTLTIILSVYLWKNKQYEKKLSLFTIISLLSLIFSATTPGNKMRYEAEILTWFPEYQHFNLVNKIDLGVSSFGKIFFFSNTFIFTLFFAALAMLVWLQSKNYFSRLIVSLPLTFNILIYLGDVSKSGFRFGDSMIWKTDFLEKIFTRHGTNLSLYHPSTWIPTLLVLGLLFSLCISIYIGFSNKKHSVFLILLLLMAFCSRVILGFSPTVWASGLRTFYITYMVTVIIILMVIRELKKCLDTGKLEAINLWLTTLGVVTFLLSFLNR